MIKIKYPDKKPKLKTDKGREWIFDPYRKKWFLLTPEEWVRQNFLLYLAEVLSYPVSLIAIEKEIRLGEVKKRFDIVIYNKDSKPFMVVECKEMNGLLTENVLYQALRYNTYMQAQFIVITNGSHCFAFKRVKNKFEEIHAMPEFGK